MEAIFSKLIEQLNSSVFVLLGILAVSFWVIFKIGKWTEKFQTHEDKISNVQNLGNQVIEIRTKVDLIYNLVNPNRLVAAHSPISLTPTGIEISNKIGANMILQAHIDPLTSAVESENPKNAYDIQLASMKVAKEKMLSLLSESELVTIKDEAYTRGMLVEDILSIFGVLLRNHVLNKRGVPIADVDKHAAQQGIPAQSSK
jgi:hypothetical protein